MNAYQLPRPHPGAIPEPKQPVDSHSTQRVRQREPLWYAICFPQFSTLDPQQQQNYLQHLAELLQQFSARVSLLPPDCIVFEVRSSLRYFGGIANIRRQVSVVVETFLLRLELGGTFSQAATPTPASCVLLARNGANVLVYRKVSLRSALGSLSIELLPVSPAQKARLKKTGLLYLRDIWRLPGAGLRQRFGNPFVNYLDQCLGNTPEPLSIFEPAPDFSSRHELVYPIASSARLLPVIHELLQQLCSFLQQRELCTTHLRMLIEHEEQTPTLLDMNLRQANRCEEKLLMLLESRCHQLNLVAPATAVTLQAEHFEAFVGRSADLLINENAPPANSRDASLQDLLEQLRARLGENTVHTLQIFPRHSPEHAAAHSSYSLPDNPIQKTSATTFTGGLRPCWLLDTPQRLQQIELTALRIISEPERIESSWWAGDDIRRDYYIARKPCGQVCWIFNSRSQPQGWYLHGIF